MKLHLSTRQHSALTLIEVLVLVVVIFLLAALFLPLPGDSKARPQRIACVNNLKQVGLAFHEGDFDQGDFAISVPAARGGASEYVADPAATWKIFGGLSNELLTPKILYCPSESEERTQATSFTNSNLPVVVFAGNTNLSYFVGVDSEEYMPSMLVAGDHNIGEGSANNVNPTTTDYAMSAATALQTPGTNINTIKASWTVHGHQSQGNIVLADGSVQQCTVWRLRQLLANSDDPGRTNAVGNWHGEAPWQNRLQFPSLR